jgi:APA family basic amino acid/polyamine antiporter
MAARVHPTWRTPVFAIAAQGIFAAILTITPFPSLVLYIGFVLTAFAALSVSSLFKFRSRPGWQKLSVVSFAWPLVPMIFLIPAVWTIIYGVTLKPVISAAGATTVIAGALVYHFFLRRRG